MGVITTFYSYKGGVGRTMALANIAVLLSKRGKKVLVVDWDLEAPGLHEYFNNNEYEKVPANKKGGLMGLLKTAKTDKAKSCWRDYLSKVIFPDESNIDVLWSGCDKTDNYTKHVLDYNWGEFYSKYSGGRFIEDLRNDWKDEYDHIFIDSRTGITDYGGICTIQLPDFLALVFTPNDQSIKGVKQVALSAQKARQKLAYDRMPLLMFPLLSRFDGKEEMKRGKRWLNKILVQMDAFYDDWIPKDFSKLEVLETTKLPYVPYFSFGEELAVEDTSLTDPDTLGYAYNRIANLFENNFQGALGLLGLQETSESLNAQIYDYIAKKDYDEAETLMRQALEIDQVSFGPDHLNVALRLNNLAKLLMTTNRLDEAESLMRRALKIDEASFSKVPSRIAIALNNLAQLLMITNRFNEAEPLMRRALEINKDSFGPDHPTVAHCLNNLAQLLQDTNRLDEAEPIMLRVIEISEKTGDHANAATGLNNLARLLSATNRFKEAEPMYRRVIEIFEKSYGKDHPRVATALNNLAQLLKGTNRLDEAEPLMRRALEIDEATFGANHADVARDLNNLAQLLQDTDRLDEAELIMRRAMDIIKETHGKDHPRVATALNNLAGLLYTTNRFDEAKPMYRRALEIAEASFGQDHPAVATGLINLAQLLRHENRYDKAETMIRRALEIFEASFGPNHPTVATALNNLAQLLQDMNRLDEAEPIMRRALEIDEASFGPNHPDVATSLNNLAQLLRNMNRLDEAEPMMKQGLEALIEFSHRTGYQHPNLEHAIDNYGGLLMEMGHSKDQVDARLKKLVIALD